MFILFQKSTLLAIILNKKSALPKRSQELTSLITYGSFQEVTKRSIPCVPFVCVNGSGAGLAHGSGFYDEGLPPTPDVNTPPAVQCFEDHDV